MFNLLAPSPLHSYLPFKLSKTLVFCYEIRAYANNYLYGKQFIRLFVLHLKYLEETATTTE